MGHPRQSAVVLTVCPTLFAVCVPDFVCSVCARLCLQCVCLTLLAVCVPDFACSVCVHDFACSVCVHDFACSVCL